MIVSTSLHKTGTMDFEQGTGDMANLKIEEMYENLSNITKQLAIIQGFIESKYGQEFATFCQFSEGSSVDPTYTPSVVDTTSIQEEVEAEEYDKMPNLISQESPSRTLGFVTVPLRQTTSGSNKGSVGKTHVSSHIPNSLAGVAFKRERNSVVKEETTFENGNDASDDMMYPLHNFTDLLEGTEDDDTNETPEFLELELDPSTLLRGEPPALQPMFESTQQQHCSNSNTGHSSSSKRSSSRQSNNAFSRYEVDVTRVAPSSTSVATSRRASVGSHENNISFKKFDCYICGIKFEFAETLKSHLESHAGARNIRSNSEDQSGSNPNVVPLPRLMPRPSIPVSESLTVDFDETTTITVKTPKSKKRHSPQMSLSPTSSLPGTKSDSALKRRREYNQSRPCALKCPECNLQIRDKSRLIEHLRGHTGERPFECTLCEKAYTRRDVLKTHMLKMHGIAPQFQP